MNQRRNRIEYKPRKWLCKCCGKETYGIVPLNKICSLSCANKLKKDQVTKKKVKAKQLKKKRPSAKSIEKKLWETFSEYIRRRDAKKFSGGDIGKCITCSHIAHWKTMDCGHGISRRHQSTKYDEKNNHIQCKGCNGLKSGKQFEYMLEVDRRYGKGTAEMLLAKSKHSVKRTAFEFQILLEEYQHKLKQL